ncbi:MAG: DUF4340 domain-containing protein [Sphingobacteriales bacterium]|nr:MAG: DUF4340 domain-containing protein [Sphingobacteriales bacterium]
MNKTVIYLVLLALLGVGVYFFVFKENDPFSGDDSNFTIKDTGSITHIFMADKMGQQVDLKRTDSGWVINDRYPAIPRVVSSFLRTLNDQQAQYPAPKNQHNNAITGLAASGIKVELYGKGNKKIKVFYVGGQVGQFGTFMLMDGAKRPYVVQIPGFEGYLTPRYSTDIKTWRDRTVFNFSRDQIKRIDLQYATEPLNSFTLTNNGGKIDVKAHEELMKGKPVNVRRAEAYAGFFTEIYAEGYLNGTHKLDSLISNAPKRAAIEVESVTGKVQHIDIYWMAVNQRSKNQSIPSQNIPDGFDADRSYAVMNNFRDTMLIQHFTFDKLFRKGYEFFEADPVQQTINPQAMELAK